MNETHSEYFLAAPYQPSSGWAQITWGETYFSRVIFGARVSVITGLAGATIATSLSTIIGMVSGYLGGKFDLILQRFVDAVMCLHGLVLLMIVVSLMEPGMWAIIIVWGGTTWHYYGFQDNKGRPFMLQAPWMALGPGLALASVVYAINMFGDAVIDTLDPRLRGGVVRYGGGEPRK